MRIVLFLAIATNAMDLVATTFGIHWFGNREGNPLLAALAHEHWLLFVWLKGLAIPFLIVCLHRYRRTSPVLASAGMVIVTLALTLAVGQWLGWIAGTLSVMGYMKL